MYTAYLFAAVIIVMGAGTLEGVRAQDEFKQSVLLRKLQNFQRDEVNNKTVTWNEILADVLVKKLNVFSSSEDSVERSKNCASKFVSSVLSVYKTFYDKYKADTIYDVQDATSATEYDPKEEVETVDAVIRNKKCDECDDVEPEESVDRNLTECPENYIRNKDGNCEDPVSSKIIMAIPRQCPYGYRPDRSGFCRRVYYF